MAVDEKIKHRIQELIAEGKKLSPGDDSGECRDSDHRSLCVGWLTQAHHMVELVCPPLHAYRKDFPTLYSAVSWNSNVIVGLGTEILRRLLADIDDGLLASIVDQAATETFDNFLDHADAYLGENRKDPAGVVAGVVFEDTIRRIYRKNSASDAGKQLDDLISALAKSQVITATKAKRARTAAHVRTKATHAQWDEFDAEDVKETVRLTRQLLDDHLD